MLPAVERALRTTGGDIRLCLDVPEAHLHPQTALGLRGHAEPRPVRRRDRRDDRQAEAVAVAVPDALAAEPVKRPQQPLDFVGGDHRAAVGDRQHRLRPGERIWVADQWFYLTGILGPAELTPEIESSVLVGFPAAERYLADPEAPNEVDVSQPSATLVTRADAKSALNGLFLGLGAVALLVGAVGVANIMVISVLERRSEIGLRRALGATRGQIRTQFLSEAILLALGGGAVGVGLGALATAVYATSKGWAVVIPASAWAGGFAAAMLIGAVAGLLPAIRAARLAPADALRTV